ncbi:hypothetical protein OG946_30895 [Streptomyces sp. NBC_01808]|uniref:hypothetical protein n=1 Tax=Streptomyces sp. NBC_01808 TaxID=2975947 RepID=UPI002DD7E101|nr:hypothetical protein [Streptomyces sp. NBC_01808]WSA41406.1 hypothetical protein OG946_30895 [Streptomyces sp. NBC_01808]
MSEPILVLVSAAAGLVVGAALGWYARGALGGRRHRRRERFFGLPRNSEALVVVNRDAGGGDWSVAKHDALALLELSAVIKSCGAHAQVVAQDTAQQTFGDRTEFCVGTPISNRRMAAHMQSLLPGVRINTDPEPGPDRGAFAVGTERYRLENGVSEHVLLARLSAGQEARPVFLSCGQRSITNQAAMRYLVKNESRLNRKYGSNSFVLLLKVVNSQSYGPDVVELVGDVTKQAQTPLAQPAGKHGKS